MTAHLYYFRPGEEARMLARCQFGVAPDGRCGAVLTYPIKGFPWRHNIQRRHEFELAEATRHLLYAEVRRLRREHSEECLVSDQLWNDTSEKANGITRDRASGTLCYSIGLLLEEGGWEEFFSLRENSPALTTSGLYTTISALLSPHERLCSV